MQSDEIDAAEILARGGEVISLFRHDRHAIAEFYQLSGVIFGVKLRAALCRQTVFRKLLADGEVFDEQTDIHRASLRSNNRRQASSTCAGVTCCRQFGVGNDGHCSGLIEHGQHGSLEDNAIALSLIGFQRSSGVQPYITTIGMEVVAAICAAPVSTLINRSARQNISARSTSEVEPQKFSIGNPISAITSSAYSRSFGAPITKNVASYSAANARTTSAKYAFDHVLSSKVPLTQSAILNRVFGNRSNNMSTSARF